ncbi:hypothetical protein RDWZM_009334 [Blomia tropicalis]|uniref:tRNA (adenine(58)-N(1))-methyltransferase non-catalytic subunit TRM6 n=1 Tax=Blomia tropicalis TaxID=40697 RepID=A0A9Q0M659_BLOTA|nr:hypothetical protein RDWZM_009334 [Blomia tropicalis]
MEPPSTCNDDDIINDGVDKYFYMGKQKINISSLIGQKFGSTFQLTSDKNLKLVNVFDFCNTTTKDGLNSQEANEQKDNRFIKDDNRSQKLTRNDIEKIKKEISGEEIIKTLVENSSTFEEKNKFSQQKYLVKKKQKYLNLFTVFKPSIKLLMEMYFAKGPSKNNFLRVDTLSQMLTLCNVMAGGNYMVVDSNLGILSAGLMERTAGKGSIVQIFNETIPNGSYRQAVYALNYPESVVSESLLSLSLNDVYELSLEENGSTCETMPTGVQKDSRQMLTKREMRLQEVTRAKSLLRHRDMHGLLLLTKDYDPSSMIHILLQFLGLSRPFVIFSHSIDPLKECYIQLKGKCLFLRISETWLRKYQVLEGRTRPEMTMNSSSGFVLSGIKAEI